MRYVSTRGQSPEIGFRQAVLSGLAPDGGLYMPTHWPTISSPQIAMFRNQPFAEIAACILSRFADPDISERELLPLAKSAFDAFDAADVAPVVGLDGENFILELFHGPTLAFKDVAMRMLAALYDWALEGTAHAKTIVAATSGDTGGAAIHAFAGSPRVEVFMLHPLGRISDVQRRMMTTVSAKNVVNIAVEGTFDDCQRIVKALFSDNKLSSSVNLGGVNSINWARIAVQTVYYFSAAAQFDTRVSFVAPTGNFGDIFAGYAAKKMGAPIHKLGVAVNSNDIMRRAIETGEYAPSSTTPTSSPSMDIQVASNFERLLYESLGQDAAVLRNLMQYFEHDGRMTLPDAVRNYIARDFSAERADEVEVADMIRTVFEHSGMLIDPHTAVGLVALGKMRDRGDVEGPAISLATAHPAKFPEAVKAASGVNPELPARYGDLMSRDERMLIAASDVRAIREIILKHSLFG